MQPFDALTIRAVLQEAKPLLINRKVDRVTQLGRDEVLVSLRGKGGMVNLFISAQSVYGRMCLVQLSANDDSIAPSAALVAAGKSAPSSLASQGSSVETEASQASEGRRSAQRDRSILDRYQSKYANGAPPNFCLILRKHLTGATLVGVEQLPGERV